MAMHGLPCVESDPLRTLKSPPMLTSFRAHIRGVTSISYLEHKELIITSSADGNVSSHIVIYLVMTCCKHKNSYFTEIFRIQAAQYNLKGRICVNKQNKVAV